MRRKDWSHERKRQSQKHLIKVRRKIRVRVRVRVSKNRLEVETSLLLALTLPHTPADTLLKLCRVLSPQPGRLYIRGTLIVGARKHRDDGEQNGLRCLHGRPALRGRFVAVFIFLGRVQDGNADFTVGIDWEIRVSRAVQVLLHSTEDFVLMWCDVICIEIYNSPRVSITYCSGGRGVIRTSSWEAYEDILTGRKVGRGRNHLYIKSVNGKDRKYTKFKVFIWIFAANQPTNNPRLTAESP